MIVAGKHMKHSESKLKRHCIWKHKNRHKYQVLSKMFNKWFKRMIQINQRLKDHSKKLKAHKKRVRNNEETKSKLIREVSIILVFMEQHQGEVLMLSQVSFYKLPSILSIRL